MRKSWVYIPWRFTNTYSVLLDGADEKINFTGISTFGPSNPFSVSFWMYPYNLDSNREIIGSGLNGWSIDTNGGAKLRIRRGNTTTGYRLTLYTANLFAVNNWYNVVVSFATVDKANIYVHGSNVTSSITHSSFGTVTMNNTNLTIGSANIYNNYYPGRLGDIAIIPWAVNAVEAVELYNGGTELDMTKFSGWNAMKADPRSVWVTWEDDNLSSVGGRVIDLINNYSGTPVNMEAEDKIIISPP